MSWIQNSEDVGPHPHHVLLSWWVGNSCSEEEHVPWSLSLTLRMAPSTVYLVRKMASKHSVLSVWKQCQSYLTLLSGPWPVDLMENENVLILIGTLSSGIALWGMKGNDLWGWKCSCYHGWYYNCQGKFKPGRSLYHMWEIHTTSTRHPGIINGTGPCLTSQGNLKSFQNWFRQ